MRGFLIAFLLLLCAVARAQRSDTVLVVANANNAQSRALASHYMDARGIPEENLMLVNCLAADSADTISQADYVQHIANPIFAKIKTMPHIDYIVLCRNLPSKISTTNGSVDSALAGKTLIPKVNRYFMRKTPFSSAAYGMYLVTRLDGWSWEDAFALVDNAQKARPEGTFFFDCDPRFDADRAYSWFNTDMRDAFKILTSAKIPALLDNTTVFQNPGIPLAGYISWGSNDRSFSDTNYRNLTFVPGAICETAVSTSGHFLRTPGKGQSQIAALIRRGITGVKGYVAEPYLVSVARPDHLMQMYTSGRNLAEAFYSASPKLGWRDVIVGDPLCAPYRKAAATQ